MNTKSWLLLLAIFLLLGSCTVSKEQVGNYNFLDGSTKTYSKEKEIYLFWDKVPLQTIEKDTLIEDYEIIKRRSFFDVIAFYGTVGIFSSYNVTIKVKKLKKQ